jgi:polysaccharide pyruvyl transferase WcaK-like protein
VKKKNKIGLLGPVTAGNLGNTALETAVVKRLAQEFPEAEFYVCTRDSVDQLKSYGVRQFPFHRNVSADLHLRPKGIRDQKSRPALPVVPDRESKLRRWLKRMPLLRTSVLRLRWAVGKLTLFREEVVFWVRSYRFARGFRYLIVCGGGQLDDVWGGPWGLPYSLFTWATLAKLNGCPFVVLSVGAERINTFLARLFLRRALQVAEYRSYRDVHSKQIAEQIGSRGEQLIYPDLAFGLDVPLNSGISTAGHGFRRVGVSPIAYCDPRVWPVKDFAKYDSYIRVLADFVEQLVKMERQVVLFASQTRWDGPVIQDVRNLLRKRSIPNGMFLEEQITELDDLLSLLARLDVVVASRLHGCLLATLVNTPVLAISHEMKVAALMADLGMNEFCVSIDALESSNLLERFRCLERQSTDVRAQLAAKVRSYRQLLDDQYDRLFSAAARKDQATRRRGP